MKKFRKIMAVLVAAMMIMATMVPAFAAQVTITYNRGEAATGESSTVVGTDKAKMPACPYTYTGHYFTGWNTSADGSGTIYQPGDVVTGNTEVWAQWADASSPIAETGLGDGHTVVIANGIKNQKYTIYKIFDVTIADAAGNSSQSKGFAYTINSSSSSALFNWLNTAEKKARYGIDLTLAPGKANTYVVTFSMDQEQARTFAADLAQNTNKLTVSGTISAYDSTDTAKDRFTDLAEGYYFVDSSMGSICSLDTTNEDVTIYEKNSDPKLSKYVREDATNITTTLGTSTANTTDKDEAKDTADDKWSSVASMDIGQTVYFKLVANTGANTNKDAEESGNGVSSNYVITDTITAAFDYKGNTSALGGTPTSDKTDGMIFVYDSDDTSKEWDMGDDYGVAYDSSAHTLTITLKQAKLAALGQNKNVTILYGLRVTEAAVIGGDGNPNSATLSYVGDEIAYTVGPKVATVYVNASAIVKFGMYGDRLKGATFTMEDANSNAMTFYEVQDGSASATAPAIYRYGQDYAGAGYTTEMETPESGVIVIYGLDVDDYTLTEKDAPKGYHLLTETVPVNVVYQASTTTTKTFTPSAGGSAITFTPGTDDANYKIAQTSIQGVENKTSTELPSTGGMGTTVLYIVGGMLVILAGAYLFFSRKRTA